MSRSPIRLLSKRQKPVHLVESTMVKTVML